MVSCAGTATQEEAHLGEVGKVFEHWLPVPQIAHARAEGGEGGGAGAAGGGYEEAGENSTRFLPTPEDSAARRAIASRLGPERPRAWGGLNCYSYRSIGQTAACRDFRDCRA